MCRTKVILVIASYNQLLHGLHLMKTEKNYAYYQNMPKQFYLKVTPKSLMSSQSSQIGIYAASPSAQNFKSH